MWGLQCMELQCVGLQFAGVAVSGARILGEFWGVYNFNFYPKSKIFSFHFCVFAYLTLPQANR